MVRRFSTLRRAVPLATATLLLGLGAVRTAQGQYGGPLNEAPPTGSQTSGSQTSGSQTSGSRLNMMGQPVLWDGVSVTVCPGGCYGGAHPFGCCAYGGPGYYGFFRRYYAYGFYGPTRNYPPGNGFLRRRALPRSPCYGETLVTYVRGPGGTSGNAPANAPATPPPTQNPPPADNAARLQLLVPENARVLVNGGQTSQTGAIREFVSPPLTPGQSYTYQLTVRYTGADGKVIDDTHRVQVRANAQLRLDCTRPTPSKQPAPSGGTTVSAAVR